MTLPPEEQLHDRLVSSLDEHAVPGAVVGVEIQGERVAVAAGTANANTGLEVRRDTLFQIGSITKVYTATAAMHLVDEDRLQLDDTLADHLPELRLADPGMAGRITVEHLLTHSAGIEGDHFGGQRGAASIAEFIAELDGWEQLHDPGELSSYCNVGWVLLGRIIEKVTGLEYHQALHALVLGPTGLHDTLADPEQLLLRPVAVGHVPGPDGAQVAPVWRLDPGAAPAGTTLCATIDDLLGFARLHLDDGATPEGGRVLAPETAQLMRRRHLPRHGVTGDAHAGYGWGVNEWDGVAVITHDGGTLAHFSTLVVVPDHRAAFAVLTNGVGGMALHASLVADLVRDTLGITRPGLPQVDDPDNRPPDLDLAAYTGTYHRAGVRTCVRVEDGQLIADVEASLAPGQPPTTLSVPIHPVGDRFVHGALPPLGEGPVDFLLEDGEARWMFTLGRANRRIP